MASHHADIVIFGAGIAGLWTFNRLKRLGYDVLLLESKSIGGGQSIASQGIIHSGLKYAFAGKINTLAKSISLMPDLWREALLGSGPVDLSEARLNASSQYLLIPGGFMGGLVSLVTRKALGGNVRELPANEWPEEITQSGFKGHVIYMDEPVLDAPSTIRALAEPYTDSIRLIDTPDDPFGFLERHGITARKIIFTAAGSNHPLASGANEDEGLKTQKRPLLMGMMKPAPFEIYAHMVGSSEKPVATVTTHKASDGSLVWYIGGQVAERGKDVPQEEVIRAAKAAFERYFPSVDTGAVHWATLPIDRVEGTSSTEGWLPDTPTIHAAGDHLYCWPTKLTFAPLLSDKIMERLEQDKIMPSKEQNNWTFLPEAPYSLAPWDEATWS